MNKSQTPSFSNLVNNIIEGIQAIKGENIKILDLRKLENSVCDFFVICEGNSNTQVASIAGSVEREVRKNLKDRPWHVEGADESKWILMDYVSTVVHVFQKETRSFYDLEGMWGDAEITLIEEI